MPTSGWSRKSDGIRTVYRPLTFWAARQAIVGRKRVRGDRTAGRFVRDEVDHLVSDTWHRYDELREHLPNQPTLGSRMNIRLAALTDAMLQVLMDAGIERQP